MKPLYSRRELTLPILLIRKRTSRQRYEVSTVSSSIWRLGFAKDGKKNRGPDDFRRKWTKNGSNKVSFSLEPMQGIRR